jgi:hypothetical protein
MNTYRIETRIPDNHLLHISAPTFTAGENVEVIILAKEQEQGFEAKIQCVKQAASDPLFLADVEHIAEDFRAVDRQDWVNE